VTTQPDDRASDTEIRAMKRCYKCHEYFHPMEILEGVCIDCGMVTSRINKRKTKGYENDDGKHSNHNV